MQNPSRKRRLGSSVEYAKGADYSDDPGNTHSRRRANAST
jgi:hypothetical protein